MRRRRVRYLLSLLMAVAVFAVSVCTSTAKADDGSVDIEATFPDPAFRHYVSINFDSDGDGYLSEAEIEAVTSIFVYSSQWADDCIYSLEGIEVFRNLESIHCYSNNLTTLDVSKNPSIKSLTCVGRLTVLDVSKNTELVELDCSQNRITELDLTRNTKLNTLDCSGNLITSLNLSKNTKLSSLNCSGNLITSLNLSKNTELILLKCNRNQLTTLNLQANSKLEELYCIGNRITQLDLSKNRKLCVVCCGENRLTNLNVNGADMLDELYCENNQLTSLNVSNNPRLNYLRCNDNQLTTLNVANNSNLWSIECRNNKIKTLNLGMHEDLDSIDCSNNCLTGIDISGAPELDRLDCSDNQITSLNIGNHKYLYELLCYNNCLTSITAGSGLGELNSHGNPLQKVTITNKYGGNYYMPAGTKVIIEVPSDDENLVGFQWLEEVGNETDLQWKNCTLSGAKTNRLSLTMQTGKRTYTYQCKVSVSEGNPYQFGPYYLSAAPVIVELSGDLAYGCDDLSYYKTVGETFTASVKAVGEGNLTYQWRYLSPNSDEWKNSSAASAKTPVYSFTIQAGHSGYLIRPLVTDENGLTGEPYLWMNFDVGVRSPITWQPSDLSVLAGDVAHFRVEVSGVEPFTYQWQAYNPNTKKWVNSSAAGAKTDTVKITAQLAHQGFKFRCIVTDGNGRKTTSDAATLSVNPKISAVPKNTAVSVGSTAKFTVAATGTGTLSYQWQAYNPSTGKWVNSGSASAKTASLSITAQAAHNGFKFRCVVTDAKGNQTISKAASLVVNPAITTQPTAKTVPVGGSAEFSIVAKGAGTLKYQWQAYNPNTKTWVNSGAASAKTANFYFTAQTGHQGFKFRCVITDGNGNKTTSSAVLLTVRPGLTAQPNNATVSVGSTVQFTIGAKGCGTLSYQWQVWDASAGTWKNSGAASAKTAKFTFTAQTGHNGKQFRCIVTDVNGNKTYSRTVTLTVK